MTATRCTHCGATLTWLAGQQFQVCWSCAKVTKRLRIGVVERTPEERERVYNPTPGEVAELLGVAERITGATGDA